MEIFRCNCRRRFWCHFNEWKRVKLDRRSKLWAISLIESRLRQFIMCISVNVTLEGSRDDGKVEVSRGDEQLIRRRWWLDHLTRLTIDRAATAHSGFVSLQRREFYKCDSPREKELRNTSSYHILHASP
jgi:hypothetical protein